MNARSGFEAFDLSLRRSEREQREVRERLKRGGDGTCTTDDRCGRRAPVAPSETVRAPPRRQALAAAQAAVFRQPNLGCRVVGFARLRLGCYKPTHRVATRSGLNHDPAVSSFQEDSRFCLSR